MAVHRFFRETLPVTPWKNGGGETREILSWPPDAGLGAFDWRVSIATIAASGPFSAFEGVDRTIMLLEGDGVRLQAPAAGIDHALYRPCQPFAFSGDLALDCTLLGGASVDFNVMSRRARGAAEVRVIDAAATLPGAGHGLLMSLAGRWLAGSESLAEGMGLWWAEERQTWHLMPDGPHARLVSVKWTPVDHRETT